VLFRVTCLNPQEIQTIRLTVLSYVTHICLDLNIIGNIWDNESTQVNKIVLMFFGYSNTKILHIGPLNPVLNTSLGPNIHGCHSLLVT